MYSISQWRVGGKSNVFNFPVGGWVETKCIPFPSEAVGLGVFHFVETGMQMLTIHH